MTAPLATLRTFEEEDLLPLSALQHVVFCERQFALIHIERVWHDNALTVEGSQALAGYEVLGICGGNRALAA